MAIRIAVCDDDVMAVGAIRGAVEKVLNEQGLAVEISEYYAVKTLRSALQQQSFDLLLLDIDMPGISGIEFGRMLRREKNDTDIIFVSNCENRVFEAMQILPRGFIRKSHFFADLQGYARVLADRFKAKPEAACIVLDNGADAVTVPVHQVVYVESSLKQQLFHVENALKPYTLRKSMKLVCELLLPQGFVRIHASYLVNFRHIAVFRKSTVLLRDGRELPMSRSNAHQAKEQYLDWMRRSGSVTL